MCIVHKTNIKEYCFKPHFNQRTTTYLSCSIDVAKVTTSKEIGVRVVGRTHNISYYTQWPNKNRTTFEVLKLFFWNVINKIISFETTNMDRSYELSGGQCSKASQFQTFTQTTLYLKRGYYPNRLERQGEKG